MAQSSSVSDHIFGVNDDLWLYQGLGWLALGKVLAVGAIAMALAALWQALPLPQFAAFATAAALAAFGGLLSFQGLTMLTNRSRRAVVLTNDHLLVGTAWGRRCVQYAQIRRAADRLDGVCLELADGQQVHIAGTYFNGAGERRLFLEALPVAGR